MNTQNFLEHIINKNIIGVFIPMKDWNEIVHQHDDWKAGMNGKKKHYSLK